MKKDKHFCYPIGSQQLNKKQAFVIDTIYKVMDAFAFPSHDVYCKYVRRFENFVNYF